MEQQNNDLIVPSEEQKPTDVIDYPQLVFKTPPAPTSIKKTNTDEIVDKVFGEAIVHTVSTDDKVQEEIITGAKKALHNKTERIKSETEREAKEAHFDNNSDACECFAFKAEKKLPLWAVNIMKVIYDVMLIIWIVLCTFTIAPVIFILQRVKNVIKTTWLAILVAVVVYICVIASPFIISTISK